MATPNPRYANLWPTPIPLLNSRVRYRAVAQDVASLHNMAKCQGTNTQCLSEIVILPATYPGGD
jgi:hypothetical protein